MNPNKLFITQRERQLLLHSEAVNNTPSWFKELLKQQQKITFGMVDELDNEKKRYLTNMYPEVIKLAQKEWKRDLNERVIDLGPDESKWDKCSLENQPIRWVFFIINVKNDIKLKVGSECIQKFKIEKNVDLEKLKEQARKIRILNEVDTSIPGIKKMIESWGSELEEYPITIPDIYSKPFIKLVEKTKCIFKDVLNESRSTEDLVECIKQYEKLKAKIDYYVNENKNKKFIATKTIVNWLKNEQTNETQLALESIYETGKITSFSIHRIREENFMKLLVSELNRVMPKNVEVVNADVNKGGYVYKYTINPNTREKIQLFCKHTVLLQEYGHKVLDQRDSYQPDFKNIYKSSKVLENSYKYFIDEIVRLVEGSRILYDSEFNEALLENQKNKSKTYVIINLASLIESSKNLYVLTKENVNELIAAIFKKYKNYSKLDLAKYEIPKWIPWHKILPKDEKRLINLKEKDFEIFYF